MDCCVHWSTSVPHDLRTFARGKPCFLRLEGCTHDPSTTVLAHLRIGGIAGIAMKSPDLCALPLDSYCHDVVDGRVKTNLSQAELRAEILRGLLQWQSYLWSHEYVIAVLPT